MKRVKSLLEENSKLREENKQLRDFINNHGIGSVPSLGNVDINIHSRMHKKLEALEEIEKDQRGREKELEEYHNWLHSIPVKYEGEEYSLDIKERLKLMEISVKMQAQELERTKMLFLRDIKIVKDELDEKTSELQHLHVRLKEREERIKQLEEDKGNIKPNPPIPQVRTSNGEGKTEIPSQLLTEYSKKSEEIHRNLTIGISSFRESLIEMMQEYLKETLGDSEYLPVIVEESKGLIEGCSEALEETTQNAQREFIDSTRRFIEKLCNTIGEGPASTPDAGKSIDSYCIFDQLAEFIKNCILDATKQQGML